MINCLRRKDTSFNALRVTSTWPTGMNFYSFTRNGITRNTFIYELIVEMIDESDCLISDTISIQSMLAFASKPKFEI